MNARDLADDLAAIADRLEVWVFDTDLATVPVEDLLHLHVILTGLNWNNGRLVSVDRSVMSAVDAQMGDDPVDVDGQLWMRVPQTVYRGLDREALRSAVNRWAVTASLDEETGELADPSIAEVLDRVWSVADVADGRTKKLREGPGIRLADYAGEVDRTSKIKAVDPSDIRPDEGSDA